jgi:hypothetical protein
VALAKVEGQCHADEQRAVRKGTPILLFMGWRDSITSAAGAFPRPADVQRKKEKARDGMPPPALWS